MDTQLLKRESPPPHPSAPTRGDCRPTSQGPGALHVESEIKERKELQEQGFVGDGGK